MVNEYLIETFGEYIKLYSELEAMGAPKEALEIVQKTIDDTSLLIKQREARALQATVAEAPADAEQGLRVGQVFKNYKELCSFMGWKSTGGDYKKARLRELETLCKYHNEGYKFIIDEVH